MQFQCHPEVTLMELSNERRRVEYSLSCSGSNPQTSSSELKAYTTTRIGVNLWHEALELSGIWSDFFGVEFGETLAVFDQESIWK